MKKLIKLNQKQKLVALYQLINLYGWSDLVVTHLSCRASQNTFYTHEFGWRFDEIDESKLIEVNYDAEVVSNKGARLNRNGAKFHATVYNNRQDVNCIIHTHTPNGVAVSLLNEALLLPDQLSMMFHDNIAFHSFEHLFDKDMNKKLIDDLGNKDILILKNHGLGALGTTIEKAFWNYYYLEKTCDIVVKTKSMGIKPTTVPATTVEETAKQYAKWIEDDCNDIGLANLTFQAALRLLKKHNLPPFTSL